ncbi:MAG: endonuclease/exonuclease/phosphatase family protein [Bacteroidetes bacterium]|jgi:endonuclease/exonuclease/phosphatase family metal-dependent hydrolase|nr:endonuclease/exonuclease/phosphatase family protein [Bacteroidota bacterium]
MIKRIFKGLIYGLAAIAMLFLIFIIIAGIYDYKPPKKHIITSTEAPLEICDTCTYSMLIWNIGYCGLSDDMDFFYDGGKQVRTGRKQTVENCSLITKFLKQNDTVDFMLLQEVDVRSTRSYYINQLEKISETLPKRNLYFARNYDVLFVPVPAMKPYGKVKSGIFSVSRFEAKKASRYSFPGNFSWPKNLFMLDRCFLVTRYALQSGQELVVVNTHNSAYDDGTLRKQEMDFLNTFLLDEYQKGHYIVVGGDWNQCPPSFRPAYHTHPFDDAQVSYIDDDYLPGWTWSYDATIPTNRRVNEVYRNGVTSTTVIDFYLTSPNITIEEVRTHDKQFVASDHQPVFLTFNMSKH